MDLKEYCNKQKFRLHKCTMSKTDNDIKHDINIGTAHISYYNLDRYENLQIGDFT